MGRLTKADRRVLQQYSRYRDKAPTWIGLMVDNIPSYLVFAFFAALNTHIIYVSLDLLFIEGAIGLMLGVLVRDFVNFVHTERTYRIIHRIIDWDLIERLLEKEDALDEEANKAAE